MQSRESNMNMTCITPTPADDYSTPETPLAPRPSYTFRSIQQSDAVELCLPNHQLDLDAVRRPLARRNRAPVNAECHTMTMVDVAYDTRTSRFCRIIATPYIFMTVKSCGTKEVTSQWFLAMNFHQKHEQKGLPTLTNLKYFSSGYSLHHCELVVCLQGTIDRCARERSFCCKSCFRACQDYIRVL